jgi:hypothetical protein
MSRYLSFIGGTLIPPKHDRQYVKYVYPVKITIVKQLLVCHIQFKPLLLHDEQNRLALDRAK